MHRAEASTWCCRLALSALFLHLEPGTLNYLPVNLHFSTVHWSLEAQRRGCDLAPLPGAAPPSPCTINPIFQPVICVSYCTGYRRGPASRRGYDLAPPPGGIRCADHPRCFWRDAAHDSQSHGVSPPVTKQRCRSNVTPCLRLWTLSKRQSRTLASMQSCGSR